MLLKGTGNQDKKISWNRGNNNQRRFTKEIGNRIILLINV